MRVKSRPAIRPILRWERRAMEQRFRLQYAGAESG